MDNVCSICYNDLGYFDTCTTICNHTFHTTCIQTWRVICENNTCPICRGKLKIKDKKYINLYILTSVVIVLFLLYIITNCIPWIPVRDEINDDGRCQWDAIAWCKSRGYTWFKSENKGSMCDIDYCYRITYKYK